MVWKRKVCLVLFFASMIAWLFGWRNFCGDWWFEDDPLIFLFAESINNPITIFTSSDIIKGYGAGLAFAPMQLFSFWLDTVISDISQQVWVAYLHQGISYLLCLFCIYLISYRLSRSFLVTICVCATWAFSPSTLAVLENLSARHYMEGLLFALLAVLLTFRYHECQADGHRQGRYTLLILIALTSFASLLFKEIYAAILLTVLFCYAFNYRLWSILLLTLLEAGLYFVYRYSAMGMDVAYTMPFLNPAEYLHYLGQLPISFALNEMGYLVYLGLALLLVYTLVVKRSYWLAGTVSVVMLLAVAVIYPISFALSLSISHPGTWYRGFFLLNTCIIAALLLLSHHLPRCSGLFFLAMLLIVATGTGTTISLWESKKRHATAEGNFLREHSEAFLLSTQAASWYIPGIIAMYHLKNPHYVHYKSRESGVVERVNGFEQVCRYQDGAVVCSRQIKYEVIEDFKGDIYHSLMNQELRETTTFVSKHQQKHIGFFDAAVYSIGQDPAAATLLVRGWTVDRADNSENEVILITDSQYNVLTSTLNRNPRPDVAKVFNNQGYVKSGWEKNIPLAGLGPAGDKLMAWVYDPELNSAFLVNELLLPSL